MYTLETLYLKDAKTRCWHAKEWWIRLIDHCIDDISLEWLDTVRYLLNDQNIKLIDSQSEDMPGFKLIFETEEDASAFLLIWM
jgi:hypothetical protein